MRTILLVLIAAVAIICLAATPAAALAGGLFPISNVDGPYVQELGRWAVSEHNKRENAALKFNRVVSAQYQIVHGERNWLIIQASYPDGIRGLRVTVEGHSVTAAMGDGEFIKSSRWIVGGHKWEIHLRPKDHWAGRHRPVTLKLVLLSEPPAGNVKAKLGCRLVDPAGRLPPSEEKSVAHKFHRAGDYSGPAVLAAREELESSGYLVDDAYTVQCTIAMLREVPPRSSMPADDDRRPESESPSPDLLRHLRELLHEGTGADVTFVVSGKRTLAAHRAVLAARSPVFKAELFGGMKEAGSSSSSRHVVEVEDMEPAVFKALLGFVYTDTVPELERLAGEEAAAMAQHLLAGADRYGFDRLKLICERKLSDCVTVGTAATTLALAEQHHCPQLKERCVEFIAGYLDAVLETEGYKHLEASCPSVLTDILKAARGSGAK